MVAIASPALQALALPNCACADAVALRSPALFAEVVRSWAEYAVGPRLRSWRLAVGPWFMLRQHVSMLGLFGGTGVGKNVVIVEWTHDNTLRPGDTVLWQVKVDVPERRHLNGLPDDFVAAHTWSDRSCFVSVVASCC